MASKAANRDNLVGEGALIGLADTAHNEDRLQAQKLPELADSQALASAMGITINELRFLCFQKIPPGVNHYRRFSSPKKWR
jgi:hypothetical protein